jgi:uncharacterized membrane protein YdjX (TVP38/TMEM64 family)
MKRAQFLTACLFTLAAGLFAALFIFAAPDELLLTYYHNIVAFVAVRQTSALLLFGLAYVIITAFGTPGSAIMTLAGGMLFGSVAGGLMSVLAATTGGTILFATVRAGFAERLTVRIPQRAGRYLAGFRRDGFFYLLFLRLTPAFPFFVVNLIAATGRLRLPIFIGATLIGIAPMSFIVASIGAGLQEAMLQQSTVFLTCKATQTGTCAGLEIGDFLNGRILWPMTVLSVIALMPVLAKRWQRRALSDVTNV